MKLYFTEHAWQSLHWAANWAVSKRRLATKQHLLLSVKKRFGATLPGAVSAGAPGHLYPKFLQGLRALFCGYLEYKLHWVPGSLGHAGQFSALQLAADVEVQMEPLWMPPEKPWAHH